MSDEFLGDRRSALEEAFFAKRNEELRQKLRQMDEVRQKKAALAAASGITDDAVLETLGALNIGSDTLTALSLVPLIAVAWADGSIDDKERGAVLSAAAATGIGQQDVSHRMLDQWLARRPGPELLGSWRSYIGALSSAMSPDERRALQRELLDRARSVAEAAGGFLGVGRKVSAPEEAVLQDLAQAFAE